MSEFLGIAMTKPGVDLADVSGIQDLDFHFDYPLLKIAFADQEVEELTATERQDGSWEVVVTHNLGYKPRVLVYCSMAGGMYHNDINAYFRIPSDITSSSQGFWDQFGYDLGTTTLKIWWSGSGNDPDNVSIGYAYYIFYDPE